jgi:ribosomal protein L7/L12
MSRPLSDEEVERIRTAIFAGRKIEAIKLYREAVGVGLKDAKDYIEALEVELRAKAPEQFSAPAKRGCAIGIICLGMLLGLIVRTLV